jgi:hypothetical protein
MVGNELRVELNDMPGLSAFTKSTGSGFHVVSPAYFMEQRKRGQREKLWSIGQSWRAYPGRGAPASITISAVGYLESECQVDYEGALGRFRAKADTTRIGAEQYTYVLTVPGAGWASVSEQPIIMSEDPAISQAASLIMSERGRALLQQNRAELARGLYSPEEVARVELMDRSFGDASGSEVTTHQSRWHPAGGPPILFVAALWSNGTEPVFAATAIFAEDVPGPNGEPNLRPLDFDGRYGLDMRRSDGFHVEDLSELDVFLNAWRIDGRLFVLKQNWGYAGSGVSLEELDLNLGLRHTPLSEAYGCD